MSQNESALFEALNAKKLSPEEVAATFVIPPQYEQLVGPDHAFLIGPRGSGKTTLLRMLQGQALTSWSHERAELYRRRIRYSSVFLPADRLWASQVPNPEVGAQLGIAAFSTQLLYALVETMLYRLGDYEEATDIHHPAELRHRSEVALVAECAEAWGLKIRTPSLLGLQGALDLRLNHIADLVEERLRQDRELADELWLRQSPVQSFRFGVRAFNRHAGQPRHRWALLLDEMELAPEAVHHALRQALRGGDESLILKLSFSPVDRYAISTVHVEDATPDNDFRPIYLWYGKRIGSRRFTGGLWKRMMLESSGSSRSAQVVLGHSEIDVSGASWRNAPYGPESRQFALIQKMHDRDAAFADYLDRMNVDLSNIESLSYSKRSATLRKVYPLLVFRDAVLTFVDGHPERRTRKKITECFTGSDAVFAALEGNPRWVKAVFSKLIAAYDGKTAVPRGYQYDVLKEAAQRFEALLRLLPVDGHVPNGSVLSLLDDIAAYFSSRAFGEFTADPPSTFKVDDKVDPMIVQALTTALSAGAVVHLRTRKSPVVLPDLYGERFRLAYLLGIRDKLEIPLRLGKATNLSSILEWAETERSLPGGDTLFSIGPESGGHT